MSLKYIRSQGELILRLQHARNGAQIGKNEIVDGESHAFWWPGEPCSASLVIH